MPVVGVEDGEQGDRDGTRVVPGHRQGRRLPRPAGAVVLADVGEAARHDRAQSEPGDEPEEREEGDVRGERDEEGEHGEDDHADDDRPAPAHPVDDRSDACGPEADADEAHRRREGRPLRGESERAGGEQLGNDGAEDDEVEALEGDGEPAQNGGPAGLPGRAQGGSGGCGHRCLRSCGRARRWQG
ncbi:Uncharacterised protein [Mycobacteroides abscessus subsp. abscessus]|nr:Uncharacterised protein [Mycobacteroides abscessus subsp. abscessus]